MLNSVFKDKTLYMTSPNISCTHAFTTRYGGVSSGIYSTLNLGQSVGDNKDNVKANYAAVCDALNISINDFVRSRQVHGANIRVVTSKDRGKLFAEKTPSADGLITNEKGIALIVYTADCVPILLHEPINSVICALHAGWRGTALNIAGKAIQKMKEEYGCSPENIKAAIGPSISKCCFETDKDVSDALRDFLGNSADNCIIPKGEKYMIDLKEANRLILKKAGVSDIEISNECTSCLNEKYWSYRKSSTQRGCQAAIITLGAREIK